MGSILGLILGSITLPPIMFDEMSSLYSIPNWISGFNISFIIVTLLMVVLAPLISYFACRNIVNESPSSAIRPKVPKVSSSGFLEKLDVWKNLHLMFDGIIVMLKGINSGH